ncbi:MAG TPA: hypothetical protein VMW87_14190, partial [Spirochaetia bacterium]|nr:hypothetical protein [Spirochaetia bacterium]
HGIQVLDTQTKVLATYYTGTGSSLSSAVYYRTADSSTDAGSWMSTGLASNGSTILSIGPLFYIPGDPIATAVYACVQTAAYNYVLYYSTNGTSFAPLAATTDSSTPYIDATTNGTYDYFITASQVLTLTGLATASSATPTDAAPGTGNAYTNLGGIWGDAGGTFSGTGDLYMTANNSILRSTDGGSHWSVVVASHAAPSGGANLIFNKIAETEAGSYKALLIGSTTSGYWVLTPGASDVTVADPSSNYQASDLRTSAITMLFVDLSAGDNATPPVSPTGTDLVFAGGNAVGLWESYYTGNIPTFVQD